MMAAVRAPRLGRFSYHSMFQSLSAETLLAQGTPGDNTENEVPADLTRVQWWADAPDDVRAQLMLQQQTNRQLSRLCNLLAEQSRKTPLASATTFNSSSGDGLNLNKDQLNKMKEKVNKCTIGVMNLFTFYLGSEHYDKVACKVTGKADIAAVKQEWPLYLHIVKLAEVAARNHRSETGTRVAEQVKDLWHGSNCPFDIMGIFLPHIAKDYLEGRWIGAPVPILVCDGIVLARLVLAHHHTSNVFRAYHK
ncbi:TPA: hypothetical protein ACH3X1_001254 [Trebouxia sp. C0004]